MNAGSLKRLMIATLVTALLLLIFRTLFLDPTWILEAAGRQDGGRSVAILLVVILTLGGIATRAIWGFFIASTRMEETILTAWDWEPVPEWVDWDEYETVLGYEEVWDTLARQSGDLKRDARRNSEWIEDEQMQFAMEEMEA